MGTSTSQEAKEYFSDMQRHRIPFKYSGPEDDEAITLVRCYLSVWLIHQPVKFIVHAEEDHIKFNLNFLDLIVHYLVFVIYSPFLPAKQRNLQYKNK